LSSIDGVLLLSKAQPSLFGMCFRILSPELQASASSFTPTGWLYFRSALPEVSQTAWHGGLGAPHREFSSRVLRKRSRAIVQTRWTGCPLHGFLEGRRPFTPESS
jgi:hypothetical protein